MVISDIMQLIQGKLSDWFTVPAPKLIPAMDEVVFDINHELNTQFKTFSEVMTAAGQTDPSQVQYQQFPDDYQRTVVVYGAAYKLYTADDEGNNTAMEYSYKYKDYLFYMLRDLTEQVALGDRAKATGYFEDEWYNQRGVWADTYWPDPM